MEEFEIKLGERLPKETLMELPKLTFSQELLKMPVPFENRVVFLSPYIKTKSQKLTASQIATRLDIPDALVVRIARRIHSPTSRDKGGPLQYAAYTDEIIEDELDWRANFDALPERMSKFRIAEYLGVNWRWVARQAAEFNVYPEPTEYMGRTYLLYPKSLVEMLRTLQLHAPLANDAYTITELEGLTGKDHRWIEKRAAHYNIELLLRTNLTSHEISYHYPATFLAILIQEKEALPALAGNWMTMSAIALTLGKSRSWVIPRLVEYKDLAEERLTANSTVEMHYPPSVLESLRALLEQLDKDGEWYSDSQIADLAKKSVYWVRARTKKHKDKARQFPNEAVNMRPTRHYPEEVMEEVVALANAEPLEAGSMVTVEEIAQMLSRKRVWVLERIGRLGVKSTLRLDRRMRPGDHYDAEMVDLLQLHFMIDEENNDC